MGVLHSANWQVGKALIVSNSTPGRHLRKNANGAIDVIGQAARTYDADQVLVAGDAFDAKGPKDRTVVQALSRMILTLPPVVAAGQA